MKFLPMLSSLLLVSPAAGQSAEPYSVYTLSGKCQNFTVGTEDLTGICATEIMQVIYTDQRMDLSIWTDDPSGRFVVFSGPIEQGTDEKGFHHIDTIIVAPDGSGNNNVTHKANGLCTFGNFLEGNAEYRCEAATKDGSIYNVAFLTDAGEPESMLD